MKTLGWKELQQCLHVLMEYAERQGVHGVDATDADLYWTTASDEWLVVDREPALLVGSLHDDIEELKWLLKEPESASSVDVDRLANVLHMVSVQLGQQAPPKQGKSS
jgi:hypothetical protein